MANELLLTFEFWLSPIKVGNVAEILLVQVQPLPKLHQLAQFLDERFATHAGLSSFFQSLRKMCHGR